MRLPMIASLGSLQANLMPLNTIAEAPSSRRVNREKSVSSDVWMPSASSGKDDDDPDHIPIA